LESDNFNAKYQEFVQLDYKEIEDFCRNNYKSDTEFVSLELLDKLVCEMKNGNLLYQSIQKRLKTYVRRQPLFDYQQ
jgi:hypothetical protein